MYNKFIQQVHFNMKVNSIPKEYGSCSIKTENDMNNISDPRICITGCETLNNNVLLCYSETRDWRLCKKQVEAFKECFERYKSIKAIQS